MPQDKVPNGECTANEREPAAVRRYRTYIRERPEQIPRPSELDGRQGSFQNPAFPLKTQQTESCQNGEQGTRPHSNPPFPLELAHLVLGCIWKTRPKQASYGETRTPFGSWRTRCCTRLCSKSSLTPSHARIPSSQSLFFVAMRGCTGKSIDYTRTASHNSWFPTYTSCG